MTDQKSLCSIISGAPVSNLSIINTRNSYVICADGGYHYCKKLGISPDVIIGDFDTFTEAITDPSCEVIKYAIEKDDTDTMLAVKLALKRGYTQLRLYGCIGGRFDHSFANIQTLAYILTQGGKGVIISENETFQMLTDGMKIHLNKLSGKYVSLFAFSEVCEGINLEGMKYPLVNAQLTNSFPLGISNEIIQDFASISLKKGMLLIISVK